jgi:hypothetical protein
MGIIRARIGTIAWSVAVLFVAWASQAGAQLSGATASVTGSTCSQANDADGSCTFSVSFTALSGATFTSRHAWNSNADVGIFSTRNQIGDGQHNVAFSATAPGSYRLDITTQRTGDLNRVSDASGCDGSADTSGIDGSSNVALASGSLSLGDPGALGNGNTTTSNPFNQTGNATIFRTSNGVAQSHALTFTWNASVRSNSCEAAVRIGAQNGTTTGCSGCEYPGSPSRTQSSDGHFVTVAFTSLCGNSTIDGAQGEQCDDGGATGTPASCCASNCTFQPPSTPCTGGTCDGAGTCVTATTTTSTTTTTIASTTTSTTSATTTTSPTTTTGATTTTATTSTTSTTLTPPVGHLKCYKAKDARAKASYTLDLLANVPGFVDETGCTVKLGAKRICVEVDKVNVAPPPPGGGPVVGPNTGSVFVSYKLKCPKQTVPPAGFTDQFGAGTFTVGTAAELLVPALPGPANDHFKCYKAKDARAKATYTMDLVAGVAPFTTELGCSVKLGAKRVCVQVSKQNVAPAPPGGGPGAGPNSGAKFISYKLKCPKQTVPAVAVADQFGAGLFTPGTAAALLVPAQ